ncbi:hypothetical protein CU669_11835 [Paramagnetospirillum kuznetsovii]|uniref:Uncharacterized protein n=1 Tax=Paramagnetospirillum kuznetsovii TaxID=2053833 RepID=A0A364NX80_9PROT|nr:hypothetical protein CU669_11835 [Paramagnetospirillum kuznetsovii]
MFKLTHRIKAALKDKTDIRPLAKFFSQFLICDCLSSAGAFYQNISNYFWLHSRLCDKNICDSLNKPLRLRQLLFCIFKLDF